ncbi:MAG: sulfotransferase [Proteobacteria bacterium]|nr:sulfotransferase [Pseudomonadota bacterium]
MTLPNFLIIGAMKGGTTSLYRYLEQHPDVFMSDVKEPRFFALENDPLDYRGQDDPTSRCDHKTLETYTALFSEVTSERAIGEASTLYLYHPDAAERIRHYVPEARLIAVLRHPVERAYSNFIYLRRDGREPCAEFRDALAQEDDRVHRLRWGPLWHYKGRGFYAQQLERYFERFDRGQIRVYLYDDLRQDPEGLSKDVFGFLGVAEDFTPDVSVDWNISGIPRSQGLHRFLRGTKPVRTALGRLLPEATKRRVSFRLQRMNLAQPPPIDPALRRELCELFRDDVCHLQDRIGRDLSAWLE